MKVAVIGSINVDLVYKLNHNLKKGETIFAQNYQMFDGGKGANQAVMLSALNDNVLMLGAVGNDGFGKKALSGLHEKDIDTSNVLVKDGNTGLAIIQVVDGDNSIVVVPGENHNITKQDIDSFFSLHPDIAVVVSQLEINYDAVQYLIDLCYEKNIKIVLNPAPASKLTTSMIDKVTYLIPNEIEFESIFQTNDMEDYVHKYQGKLLITLGSKGVLFFNGNVPEILPAQKIDAVDTTGAGDSFIAGFTTGIIRNYSLRQSIELGMKIASLTCQIYGAQSAFNQVKGMMKL